MTTPKPKPERHPWQYSNQSGVINNQTIIFEAIRAGILGLGDALIDIAKGLDANEARRKACCKEIKDLINKLPTNGSSAPSNQGGCVRVKTLLEPGSPLVKPTLVPGHYPINPNSYTPVNPAPLPWSTSGPFIPPVIPPYTYPQPLPPIPSSSYVLPTIPPNIRPVTTIGSLEMIPAEDRPEPSSTATEE